MSLTWTPLESNPEVLTNYIRKLGAKNVVMQDVYGFDSDMLALITKPVKSLILLFPCKDKDEKNQGTANSDDAFYMKQTIRNACGTIALIHAILNNVDSIQLDDGSVIQKFYEEAKALSPEERGKLLESDEAFTKIHDEIANQGDTEPPSADNEVLYHFVALVNKNDSVLELDGRKDGPIKHGETTKDSFLVDAGAVCKKFMESDPKELRFTVLALCIE